MHRLPTDTGTLENGEVAPDKATGGHLKVLRPKDGEEFELFDGRGAVRRYRWNAKQKRLSADGDIVRHPKAATEITLFACITKGQRWDWTLQKATELGVARIVPVISERTIVRIGESERSAKAERWRKIAEEAARQSDAVWTPAIDEPTGFRAALAAAAATQCFVGAITNPPAPPLLRVISDAAPSAGRCSVFIGPEGDFTPDELAQLLEFAKPASFGRCILRAETAAIYALSVLTAAIHAASKGQ